MFGGVKYIPLKYLCVSQSEKNHHKHTFYIAWMQIEMNTAALYIQNTIDTKPHSTMFWYWEHFIIHNTLQSGGPP